MNTITRGLCSGHRPRRCCCCVGWACVGGSIRRAVPHHRDQRPRGRQRRIQAGCVHVAVWSGLHDLQRQGVVGGSSPARQFVDRRDLGGPDIVVRQGLARRNHVQTRNEPDRGRPGEQGGAVMRNHASGAALAAGVVALFIWAPIAGADDSPSCAPDAQHCQEQQKNPGEGGREPGHRQRAARHVSGQAGPETPSTRTPDRPMPVGRFTYS
jgi:hypothetical protein